ncbi:MAG: acyltransferase family protein [Gammaproteobacteria bacterium]|nr:acyltransferase family protein [Gammaproteobacteria bacterium]
MKYRSEIDGLRAVAVVPAIMFHAGFESFSGGYIGVDVFFVVSGYLITTLLVEDIEKGRFSLAGFYVRRARRILPALFLVMLCSLPFAWLWMVPRELEDFSQSLVATSLFASNVLFWRESGYFEAAAELKPLLHTWSLAVEEQYYVLFPLLLFGSWRLGRKRVVGILVTLATASLLLSEWSWRATPTANFYLAPTRVWEIFAGSIAAFIVLRRGVRRNDFLAMTGLLAILSAVFAFDRSTPIPSLFALLPVMGVVLLVLYGASGTLAARILSTPLFVGIGLISYSAYLWHQPILAFARLRSGGELTTLQTSVLIAFSMVLAVISWRYVEQPFRDPRVRPATQSRVFSYSAAGLVLFASIGLSGYLSGGLPFRLTPEQQRVLAYEDYPRQAYYRERECFLLPDQPYGDFSSSCVQDGENLLWGDSHAAALASGWRQLDPTLTQLTASFCPPLLDISEREFEKAARPHCQSINASMLAFLKDHPGYTVYLHANWKGHGATKIARLEGTIRQIKDAGVAKVVIIGGVPQYQPTLPQVLLSERKISLARPEQSVADVDAVRRRDDMLRDIARATDARFVSIVDLLCNGQVCDSVVAGEGGFEPVAWDYGHLTRSGAEHVMRLLLNPAS